MSLEAQNHSTLAFSATETHSSATLSLRPHLSPATKVVTAQRRQRMMVKKGKFCTKLIRALPSAFQTS